MPVFEHQQYIKAPWVYFDLARNVRVFILTTSNTKEKAIAGVTAGLLEEGDSFTWEAIHFGNVLKN